VTDRFVDALERADLQQLVELLTDDAKLTMPPEPIECVGPHAIAEFYRNQGFWGQAIKFLPTRANNQPAFGYYLPDPVANIHRASGILVLTLEDNRLTGITRFADRGLIAQFGLPRTIPR
jgi:RNA polymerase sigma-70 factor, ECF subfamily